MKATRCARALRPSGSVSYWAAAQWPRLCDRPWAAATLVRQAAALVRQPLAARAVLVRQPLAGIAAALSGGEEGGPPADQW